MKFRVFSVIFVVAALSAIALGQKADAAATDAKPAAKLPAVREIIDRYVAAVGGREAILKHSNRVTKFTVEMAPMGITGTGTSYQAAPDKVLIKMNLNGLGEFLDGFDGKNGWTVNPIQGSRVKSGPELAQAKINSTFHRDAEFEKLYGKSELLRIEKVGGADAYVVSMTAEGLDPDFFYFDVKSGLLVRSDSTVVSADGKIQTSSFFSDYREVDGIKLPFTTRSKMPQLEIIMNNTEIKHGVEIDSKIFSKP